MDEHHLKLDTFIKTARSAQSVVEALNVTFFNGTLEYELIVLPPEPGTFLSKLKLWIGGGVAGVFAFANSPVGSEFIEGLTGKPPTEWSRELGEAAKDTLEATSVESGDRDISETESIACETGSLIVVEMTRGLLEKTTDELRQLALDIEDLDSAVDARADFYVSCIEDSDIKAIGFAGDDKFPIPRNSFPERAIKPIRREKEEEPPEWFLAVENVFVTSPNWDVDDQATRQWKGKDQVRRTCYFVIEDAEFWELVKRKELHADVLDVLKVQWAYQLTGGRPKNRRVLRVLEFNGEKLADPLSSDAVNAIVGTYSQKETSMNQAGLFDDPLIE